MKHALHTSDEKQFIELCHDGMETGVALPLMAKPVGIFLLGAWNVACI
jgi:hypothetical protein